jgi:uncharacterized membrane protein
MSTTSRTTTSSFGWFVLLIMEAVGTLAAFWILLGERFSPENYETAPIVPDTVEFTVLGGALVVTACALVLCARHRDAWLKLARGALPVAAVSLFVLLKPLLMARIRMYDMLLFSVACGWTASRLLRGQPMGDARTTRMLRFAVWGLVVVLAGCQFRQQARYLNDLALGYADCGENARLMFNSMVHPGELFLRVNPDKPLFYDHVNVGIIPFLPLWLLWPDLKLTILLQLVAVFGAAVPLYFIAKRWLHNELAALLVVLVWVLYPSTSQFVYSASYGFRWGNLCLLLYFVALALWVYERRGWALACAVWAMLIKEEAAIVVGMFGAYLALFERRKTAGFALSAFAFGYFLLVTSVLIPSISGRNYAVTRFFQDLGQSKWDILLSPLVNPTVFWDRLSQLTSLYFAAVLLAPLLLLPFKKPSVLFVGSLTFVFCCMNPILKSICFHYQAALLPVAFWALMRTLHDSDPHRRVGMLGGVVVSCAATSLFLGALPWSKETLAVQRSPGRLELVKPLRGQIDPRGSLFATQRIAAHFVTQRHLYLDPPVPNQIDSALLDMRDSWRGVTGDLQWLQSLRRIQREVEANPNLHLVAADGGLLLYSRHGVPIDPRTFVEQDDLPAAAARSRSDLAGGVSMVGFTAEPVPHTKGAETERVRVTAFFTVAVHTNIDVAVRCLARVAGNQENTDAYGSEFQLLGQSVWPIERWETNKYYADVFIIAVPAGASHEISAFSFDSQVLSP